MRKLLVLSLILIAFNVFGQQQQTAGAPALPGFVVTLEIGTDTVRNGIDTVKLTDQTITEMNEAASDTNYVVMLTPIRNCGSLSLIKTNRFYFIIKEQSGASPKAAFDYVVFTKQSRPFIPIPPHRIQPAPQGH